MAWVKARRPHANAFVNPHDPAIGFEKAIDDVYERDHPEADLRHGYVVLAEGDEIPEAARGEASAADAEPAADETMFTMAGGPLLQPDDGSLPLSPVPDPPLPAPDTMFTMAGGPLLQPDTAELPLPAEPDPPEPAPDIVVSIGGGGPVLTPETPAVAPIDAELVADPTPEPVVEEVKTDANDDALRGGARDVGGAGGAQASDGKERRSASAAVGGTARRGRRRVKDKGKVG